MYIANPLHPNEDSNIDDLMLIFFLEQVLAFGIYLLFIFNIPNYFC